MNLTPENLTEGQPVKFKCKGFPEETAVQSALEKFYQFNLKAHREFTVVNMFDEPIITGSVDERGLVRELIPVPRTNSFHKKPESPEDK